MAPHEFNVVLKKTTADEFNVLPRTGIEEAGRYLETYKAFENKPPDLIMEKSESNYLARLSDTMTAIKKVNKTDAVTLLSTFGSFERIVAASEDDLSLCPGMGPQKAARVHKVIHQSFVKETKGSK